jgi:mRNA interferase YafQ
LLRHFELRSLPNLKTVRRTTQFKKDIKRLTKRHKDFAIFKTILNVLLKGNVPDPQYHDHQLVGEYIGYRECHLEPDWLLIYEAMPDFVTLIRTGTHSDLFKT